MYLIRSRSSVFVKHIGLSGFSYGHEFQFFKAITSFCHYKIILSKDIYQTVCRLLQELDNLTHKIMCSSFYINHVLGTLVKKIKYIFLRNASCIFFPIIFYFLWAHSIYI